MVVDLPDLQRARRDLVAALAIGGAVWAVVRGSGDGISAAPTLATVGTVTGVLHRTTAEGVRATGADTPGPAVRWQFERQAGVTLQAGDELTSVSSPSIACRLTAPTGLVTGDVWEATRR